MPKKNLGKRFSRDTASWNAKMTHHQAEIFLQEQLRSPKNSSAHVKTHAPEDEDVRGAPRESKVFKSTPIPKSNEAITVNTDAAICVTLKDEINSERENENESSDLIQYTDSPWHYIGMMLVTIPLFMGYATLALMQRNVRDRMGIIEGSKDARVFNAAISFLYLGNLIFRLMNNFLFTFLRPRHRVYFSYFGMMLVMNLLGWLVFIFGVKSLSLIFVVYLLGGICIGTFESNVISVITPLGHRAKSWAVTGIPIGFNIIAVGCFLLIYCYDHVIMKFSIYMAVFLSCIIGVSYYRFKVKDLPSASSQDDARKFIADVMLWRQWLIPIWAYCTALTVDKFCLGLFGSIHLYTFTTPKIPIWPGRSVTVSKNLFYSLYSLCCLLGDSSSRKVAYIDHARQPFYFLIPLLIGAVLALSKVLVLSLLGVTLIFIANGSIYAHTTRRIDQKVPKRFNLIALSVWLFIGDFGSYSGSNLNSHIPRWINSLNLW